MSQMWDYNILNNRIANDFGGSQDAFTTYLLQQIQGPWAANVTKWTSCVKPNDATCVAEWGNESAGLACTYSYSDENGV